MTRYAGKGTHQRVAKEASSWEELNSTPAKKKRFSNDRGNFKGQRGRNKNFNQRGNFRQKNVDEGISANFVQLGERAKPFGGGGKKNVQGFGQSKQVKMFGQFWVPVDDAKRLRTLSKKMKDEGLSKKEISEALKNERRKAEKSARRARDKTCFSCRQFGHILFDCPKLKSQEQDNDGGDLSVAKLLSVGDEICFKCGSTEHTSRHCKKSADKFDFASCFVCKKKGHIARQCPENSKGIYPTGGCCNECGESTHLAKDCPTLYPAEEGSSKQDDVAVTSRIISPFASSEYEGETFVNTKKESAEGGKSKSQNVKRPIKETMDSKPATKKRRVKF